MLFSRFPVDMLSFPNNQITSEETRTTQLFLLLGAEMERKHLWMEMLLCSPALFGANLLVGNGQTFGSPAD
jgi:hypothetical protein